MNLHGPHHVAEKSTTIWSSSSIHKLNKSKQYWWAAEMKKSTAKFARKTSIFLLLHSNNGSKKNKEKHLGEEEEEYGTSLFDFLEELKWSRQFSDEWKAVTRDGPDDVAAAAQIRRNWTHGFCFVGSKFRKRGGLLQVKV